MRKRRFGIFAVVVALVFSLVAFPVYATALSPTAWNAGGSGSQGIYLNEDGDLVFAYYYSSDSDLTTGTWSFSSTATQTETLHLTYVYTCDHANYLAMAEVYAFVYSPPAPENHEDFGRYEEILIHNGGNVNELTGSVSINLRAGDTYGFLIGGSNSEPYSMLQGSLTITRSEVVTFDSAGGSSVANIYKPSGAPLTPPADPTLQGYTFAGWDPYFPSIMPEGGAALTAQWLINSYTITFDSAGGSPVDSVTAEYGANLAAPTNPTRTGYTFDGWSPVFPDTMPLDGAALIAQWTPNLYTITFDSAGGSSVDSVTAEYGANLTAPADPTLQGYTFAGWNPSFPSIMPEGGAALTAQWLINSYTITFDSDGGTPVDSMTTEYGANLTAPADPTREGHTFNGWSPAFPDTMPLDGAALTAQWLINSYTITFDSAGGSPVDSVTAEYGANLTAPTDPTRVGYTFDGWSPAFPDTMPFYGAELTAQWLLNSYTITFDSAGGTPVDSMTTEYGANLMAPSDPTREGHTFNGWNSAFPDTMPLDGAVLTAQWLTNSYTITFDSAGGTPVDSMTTEYGASLTTPTDPTRTGYTFDGWSPAFPDTMPLDGAVLTAQWTPNSYTITFDSAGGTPVDSVTAEYGANLTAPADPTREGYTFDGWSPAFPDTMPLDGAVLTAQWLLNSYTITFDSAGGSSVDSVTDEYGANLTAPADPTREGHTFNGWNSAFPDTMPLDGAELTAQWAINYYTVTIYNWDGTLLSTQIVMFGESAVMPSAPQREGFRFVGWSEDGEDIADDSLIRAVFESTMPRTGERFSDRQGLGLLLMMSGLCAGAFFFGANRKLLEKKKVF